MAATPYLAGSASSLLDVIRTAIALSGTSLHDAFAMAARTPRALLSRDDPGDWTVVREVGPADVMAWLAKHPRFELHFTPTSSSWLNLVERWFRGITDNAIRRGAFGSVRDLISVIETYLEINDDDPTPLVWTAAAASILAKVRRGRQTLETSTSQK